MVIAVTNRKLCKGSFLDKIEALVKAAPAGIILREKDLGLEAYEELAEACQACCRASQVPLIVNTYTEAARKLGITQVQLPFQQFIAEHGRDGLERIYVSVHSSQEAIRAEQRGADAIIAGHIFQTDCKKGAEPRGLSFLAEVAASVKIPVFAIGGVEKASREEILQTGAAGVCMMSSLMKAEKPAQLIRAYNHK